jgi:hypothetical protein
MNKLFEKIAMNLDNTGNFELGIDQAYQAIFNNASDAIFIRDLSTLNLSTLTKKPATCMVIHEKKCSN